VPASTHTIKETHLRRFVRFLVAIGGGACVAALVAAPALAGTITDPTGSGNPPAFAWPGDQNGGANGNPIYRDVSFSGYPAGVPVYVEVCDGISPSSAGYDPADHCDPATSPSSLPGPSGTFQASDFNHKFRPFKGESPQSIFICLSPNDPVPPNPNSLPVFRNCQLRISTNKVAVTGDQAYLTLTLPDASGGGEVPEVPYAVVLPLGAAAIGGAFFFIRKRRAAHAAA
jgi:hypothetical protein